MPLSVETKDRFERLVRVRLSEPLRAAGYRKARYTWWRSGNPVGSVIDVQRRRNQGDEPMSFTINWGVHVAGYELLAWPESRPATPKSYLCPIAGRIAAFTDDRDRANVTNDPIDVWWDITQGRLSRHLRRREQSDAEVERELAELVTRMVGYLAGVTSLDQVIDIATRTQWLHGGKAVDGSHPSGWHFNATTSGEPVDLLRQLGTAPDAVRP